MSDSDPYALSWGDWEDPYDHDSCTGCDMCRPWEGRPYEQIRADRRAFVARERILKEATELRVIQQFPGEV